MGGAPPLLAMNGRGYTVLHVHNESSASGQAPEEEGPGRGSPLPMGFHSSSTVSMVRFSLHDVLVFCANFCFF